jgi:hypothetical protein
LAFARDDDFMRARREITGLILGSSPRTVMTIEKEIVMAGLDPAIARRLRSAAWNFLSSLEYLLTMILAGRMWSSLCSEEEA